MDGFSRSGGGDTDGGAQAHGWGDCGVVGAGMRDPAGEGREGRGTRVHSCGGHRDDGIFLNWKERESELCNRKWHLSATVE